MAKRFFLEKIYNIRRSKLILVIKNTIINVNKLTKCTQLVVWDGIGVGASSTQK